MRTTQRAVFRRITKNESLRFLRMNGVKRRHAFYKSYRFNCDRHNYFMLPIHRILEQRPTLTMSPFPDDMGFPHPLVTKGPLPKKYEKPVILERYNNPSVADCVINKRI